MIEDNLKSAIDELAVERWALVERLGEVDRQLAHAKLMYDLHVVATNPKPEKSE